jgi:hypothetical protein
MARGTTAEVPGDRYCQEKPSNFSYSGYAVQCVAAMVPLPSTVSPS